LTVKRLAKLAGVSVRTLHYYDEIGLLRPSRSAGNSYRRYDERAALRLQQILFYKELGLSLDEIGQVLDAPGFDVLRALEEHRRALEGRLGRLRTLLGTVERTIAHLKGEQTMDTQGMFAGFSDEEQARYEQEAEQLWGETVRESSRRWKTYSAEKKAQIVAEAGQIYTELVAHLDEPPGSPAVQALIGRWHQNLRYHYEPTPEILRGLAGAYVEDARFRATFDRIHPRLAEFVRSAVEVYVG
jgi:DNA-binding transcriptional MerR regulator